MIFRKLLYILNGTNSYTTGSCKKTRNLKFNFSKHKYRTTNLPSIRIKRQSGSRKFNIHNSNNSINSNDQRRFSNSRCEVQEQMNSLNKWPCSNNNSKCHNKTIRTCTETIVKHFNKKRRSKNSLMIN